MPATSWAHKCDGNRYTPGTCRTTKFYGTFGTVQRLNVLPSGMSPLHVMPLAVSQQTLPHAAPQPDGKHTPSTTLVMPAGQHTKSRSLWFRIPSPRHSVCEAGQAFPLEQQVASSCVKQLKVELIGQYFALGGHLSMLKHCPSWHSSVGAQTTPNISFCAFARLDYRSIFLPQGAHTDLHMVLRTTQDSTERRRTFLCSN